MIFHVHAFEKLSERERSAIHREHRQLTKYLGQLTSICNHFNEEVVPCCQSCGSGKQASCQGLFPSCLYLIIELTSSHFIHEEKIMLGQPDVTRDYEQFQKHYKAHAKIMDKLHKMVDEYFADSQHMKMSELYRNFYEDIKKLFDAHDKAFDNPFLKSH